MTDTCVRPEFNAHQAAALARDLYGLDGACRPLAGERDLNFLLDASSGRFVLKIANEQENPQLLACQHEVLDRIAAAGVFSSVGKSVSTLSGESVAFVDSAAGVRHPVRVTRYVEGQLLSAIQPHKATLLERLGEKLGKLDRALTGYTHEALDRPLLWRLDDAPAIVDRFLSLVDSPTRRELVVAIQAQFSEVVIPRQDLLRRGVIHNDANDNNILVAGSDPWSLDVVSIIDFGDMIESWQAAEPAIAAAYAMLGKDRPLDAAASVIRGYHREQPLEEAEVAVLYALMRARLAMSVCIAAHQQSLDPDNEYLRISEAPAWALLERLDRIPPDYAHFLFRAACGLEPVPATTAVTRYLDSRAGKYASLVDVDLAGDDLLVLDTSVGSPHLGTPGRPVDQHAESRHIFRALEDTGARAGIGRYAEYRLIYDSDDFVDFTGHRRTLHLGIDVFQPAGSPVYAPLAGRVHGIADNDAPFDYGGTVILAHPLTDGAVFYTLYGHLSPESLAHLEPGDAVAAGDLLGRMGDLNENGNWPPHVHFEVVTDMLDQSDTFVGVGSHAHREVWLSLCPDPSVVLGIPGGAMARTEWDADRILDRRKNSLNPSLSLSYRAPLHMARGGYQYLYDYSGRRYLDAVNNVPHVGHCHPRVVAAERAQAGVLNTNTRYLYDSIARYTERLLAYFPAPLEVCYFTCSGSEANDLALRLARHHTARRDVVVLDHAYHGNLATLIDVSPYKHDGRGGAGTPGHVHKALMPDTYRGPFRHCDPDAAIRYAEDVGRALEAAEAGGGAAAFLAESALGCGGQVFLPDGYLAAAYARARAAGAVCIADEVQVGFGRVGSHFWAFETQGVVPDIVTLGKPIGNGHPMAAVITTREIADSFNNGMEYFNTFGGNPVSCAIGEAVLDVIEQESLQANARSTGEDLLQRLRALQTRFPLIGDVRGQGLFVGIELVLDPQTLAPAHRQASCIAERLREEGILISTDGPLHNVLKIKPPMCFNGENAVRLANTLEAVLAETFARPNAG